MNQSRHIPLNKALVWILLSVLLISGSALIGTLYYHHIRDLYANDDTFRVKAIVQTTAEKESLKNAYLAELLNLSVDKPTNLYKFSSKEALRKLLASPLIKEAKVKKIKPGTVYVDYTLRKPIAFLADFTNTAIDSEGALFPFKPFFTPKRLPEIFLGEISLEGAQAIWGMQLQNPEMKLALEVMHSLPNYGIETAYVRRIDVSKAYASSCGQQQIVVMLDEQIETENQGRQTLVVLPRILRLNSADFKQCLANYKVLSEHLMKQKTDFSSKPATMIVDLRLPQLAYMSTLSLR